MSKVKKDKKVTTEKPEKEKKSKQYEGTFISNPRGFGFVEVEGLEDDFFVPEEFVKTHGSYGDGDFVSPNHNRGGNLSKVR